MVTLSKSRKTESMTLSPTDNRRLADLSGQFDQNLRQIERYLGVEISNRGHTFNIIGPPKPVNVAKHVIEKIYAETATSRVTTAQIYLILQSEVNQIEHPLEKENRNVVIHTGERSIQPRSQNQYIYVDNISKFDINFGIGPSGTGKTYLAVACAVAALESDKVRRIVLVRPAVEAGEKLGFLPGDMADKVDPYLRPLYDALYEMLGTERTLKFIEQNIIEIAPLAFMRGRSLNDAFIILDESQNTTKEQMKMFLTRIGFGSKVVVTGDITQVDLPKDTESGLRHVIKVLKDIDEISFTFFQAHDVVRHPLVQQVVNAYDKFDERNHD
jgi:phosphate starvation-inducible protein PhoH and related proteins